MPIRPATSSGSGPMRTVVVADPSGAGDAAATAVGVGLGVAVAVGVAVAAGDAVGPGDGLVAPGAAVWFTLGPAAAPCGQATAALALMSPAASTVVVKQ